MPCRTRVDPRDRIRYFESKGEQHLLFLLLARPDIVDIWDQPPPIWFVDLDGRRKKHTFDFLVTLADGSRVAIAYKPYDHVVQHDFRRTLAFIKAATPLSYAQDVILVTERSFTPSAARNAQKLHEFRRTPDPDADASIERAISGLEAPVTIAELAAVTGLAGRAFRAAFRAIYSGLLKVLDVGDILPTTRVVREVAL